MALKLAVLAVASVCLTSVKSEDEQHAHSFQQFHGPVVGHDREITWVDKHGHHHQDYAAQPHYEYSYGVEDHHTGDFHGQKEHRDGKGVVGEYTVKEPSGNIRTVKYHAGDHGFVAKVHNSHDNDHHEDQEENYDHDR